MDEEEIAASDILEPVKKLFPPATEVSRIRPYQVFINYRGPDVKKTLASLIHYALDTHGLRVFLDERVLQVGDPLTPVFQSAIRSAFVHVAIFSKGYAQSPFCLNELLWMLDDDPTSTKIIPIFYDIQPSDLRYVHKGAYAGAFKKHRKNKGRYTIEQVDGWISALNKVSCISGVVINTKKDDHGDCLAKIVDIVLEKVGRVPLYVCEHPVGLDPTPTVGHDEVETPEFYNDFKDPIDIGDLIRRMKELLRTKKSNQPENASTSSQVTQKIDEEESKLTNFRKSGSKFLKFLNNQLEKTSSENLDEATKVAMELVQQLGETHWIVGGLSMITYLLFKIDKISKNRNYCLELLGYMIDLAEHIRRLECVIPQEKEKFRSAIQVIFKGSITCACQLQSKKFFRFMKTSVNSKALMSVWSRIKELYPDLLLTFAIERLIMQIQTYHPISKPVYSDKAARQMELADSSTSISRVPQDLRSLGEAAYDPKIVGLGIYHHKLSLFSSGEGEEKVFSSGEGEEKVKALCITAKRLKGNTVDSLVTAIKKLDQQIRNCYEESTGNLSQEKLAWNFAMDACFILEFFRLLYCRSDHTIQREIVTDIFKLENQIPLFVLLKILELEFHTRENAISSLADILCMHPEFSILPFRLKPMESGILQVELKANIEKEPCHLLHLLSKIIETFLQPSNISTGDTGMDTDTDIVNDLTDFMSAVVNKDADIVQEFLIRFTPSKDGQVRFKKGWFGSGVLYLPQVYLFEETEPLFWNLIAFAARSENIIGHFMFFLKCVICSNSKSVALLRKAEIIISKRSDEELYTMFNNLSNVISESCGPFENVWSQARQHYSSPINKWTLWFTSLVFRFALIGFCLAFLFAISGWVNTHFVLVSVSVLAVSLLLFHGFRLLQDKIQLQPREIRLELGEIQPPEIQLERREIQEGELREIQEGELPEKQESERELHERLERRELQEGELPEKQERERELHGRLERREQQAGELHERLERERLVRVEGQVQRSSISKREVRRHKFSFPDLSHATGGFSEEFKLGSGSFGTVYLGTLLGGRKVAIKRGDPRSAKKNELELIAFENRLSFVTRLCHKHLVGLVGYCVEADERLLVYDYMPHGSLHDQLHKAATINPPLDSWAMRIKIALDAARGIEYLHNYAVPPIIHRDIKSSNILLDGSWNAKVSDFKISLLDEDSHLSLMVAGTVGYIDPEYYKMQHLTTKSDVYSYGVVLMELLTGKRAIHKHDGSGGPRYVVDYALPYIVHDDLPTILDDRLLPPRPHEIEAVAFVGYMAVDCVNLEGKDRPSMMEIVNSLETALSFCSQAEVSVSRTRSPPSSDDEFSVL